MRLFVSVEPSPAAVRSLEEVIARLRPLAPEARFTGAERWHLTLAFLGEVEQKLVDRISAELTAAAAAAEPLRLQISGGGTFGSRGRSTVLWAGLIGDVEQLRRLARAVARGVRHAGVQLERRPFRPHLTVARFRQPSSDAQLAVEALASYSGPVFTVSDLHLVRSYLGPHPRHEKLRSWPLGRVP